MGAIKLARRGRSVTRTAACLVAVMAAAAMSSLVEPAAQAAPARRRPNILIIFTDDQREGSEVMPALRRRVIRRGVRFSNAYATTPYCCPSRASLFTGQYSHNHRVVDNRSAEKLDLQTTLQYYLQRNGYLTGIVGKYINGWQQLEDNDPSYFDKWSVLTSGHHNYYRDGEWNVNGKVVTPRSYATNFIRKWTLTFLQKWNKRRDDKPWFLTIAPTAPHSPYTPQRRYEDAEVSRFSPHREKDRSDKPPFVRGKRTPARAGIRIRRKQFRTLMSLDDTIDRVMTTLEETKEARRTLVIFMSDNGLMWSEHGLAKKGTPYTESVKVPLFMRWPGHFGKGVVDKRPAANVDLAPTVLDAARVEDEVRAQMDGRSLLERGRRDRVHLEYLSDATAIGAWASTRTREYQYVEYYGDDEIVDFREYYNLKNDPHQNRNLLGDDDPTNDPPHQALLSVQLRNDRDCKGADCP